MRSGQKTKRRRWTTATAVLTGVALLAACGAGDGRSDATTTTRPPRVALVALGDSFSSGEGAAPYDATPSSCKRSDEGWARRLDRDAPAVVSLDVRACSGATAPNLTEAWAARKLPAQLPTTPDPTVTLVTLTIGGNDIGFSNIVGQCFIVSCADVPTSPGFLGAIHALTDALAASVYPAIERAYPMAEIVHVGYPQLTPAPGRPVRSCAWLTTEDQAAAAAIVTALDGAIRDATVREGRVHYAGIDDALAGHELCSGSSWVNPVTIGGESAAHPTAKGQRAMERAIAAALRLTLRDDEQT